MIEFKTSGTFGKFKYTNIPTEFMEALLPGVVEIAYKAAVRNAPWDPEPDGVHIKEDLKMMYSLSLKLGAVWIRSPYANSAEYGTKSRLPHPYMRPASKAGQQYMRRNIKKIINQVLKERAKHGNS